jgi:hypothetical protein
MKHRIAASLSLVLGALLSGCKDNGGQGDGGGGPREASGAETGIPETCGVTPMPSISGLVYAPNGVDPVDRALIYVARGEVPPLPPGNECDLCKILASGVWVQTHSGPRGHFSFEKVPTGPLKVVVQLGRFRRIVPVDAACGQTITLTAEQTRFPRKKSEGDVPKVAVATGPVDRMQDVLSKIGLQEFDLYEGRNPSPGGTVYPKLDTLLADAAKLGSYHIVLLNCSDGYHDLVSSGPTVKNLQDFVNVGGRLFVDDLSYEFVEWPFPKAVDFEPDPNDALLASEIPQPPLDAAQLGKPVASVNATIVQPELKAWLEQFPNTLNNDGTVTIEGWLSHWAVMHAAGDGTRVWVQGDVSYYPAGAGVRPLTASVDPVGLDGKRCGRVAFNSYHTVPNQSSPTAPFVPQERILEYIFFRVADCLTLQ